MAPDIAAKKAWLESYSFTCGARNPHLNTNYSGKFMVVEQFEEWELPTEDGSNGPWCIVGDDLEDLISQAYDNFYGSFLPHD